MRYRIRPIDGAFVTMILVIVVASTVPLREHRWISVFAAIASILVLVLLVWQVWRGVSGKLTRSSEPPEAGRRLRLILGLVILFPLGLLLMTEVLDIVARHTVLFVRASDAVSHSPALCREVGCPISIGWPIKVSISATSDSGAGSIEIPLSGTKKHAKLYVEGTKQNGIWTLNKEYFKVDKGGEAFSTH